MRNIIHDTQANQVHVLDQRFYTNDFEKYWPSATTILDAFPKGSWYVKWLKEQGENADSIRDAAADKGSAVHNATEAIDNGLKLHWADESGKPFFALDEWQMILNYKDFKEKVNPTIIANELPMCSDELKFGGTLDRIVEFGGKRWVLDIKTSNQMADTYHMQISSYAKLWNEKHPDLIVDDCCILWLKANIKTDKIDNTKGIWQGKPYNHRGWQIITFDEPYEKAFEGFKHVQHVFNLANPNYKPLNLIYPDVIKP
jgi:hypothetical protein